MKTMPFFKFDSVEWLSGKVQLLSSEEKGVFIDLLALIWKNSGSIENNRILPRLLHLETQRFSEIIQAFLDLKIIEENESVLSVKFLNVQIQAHKEFCEKQSRNGRKGGRPENPNKATCFTNPNSENPNKATGNPNKATESQEERRNKKGEIRKEKEEISLSPLPPHGGERATSENFLDDEIFQKLNACFLNSSSPQKALPAVRDALDESGVTLEFLIDRCETYGRYIRLWPQEERRFSYSLTSFIREGHFREDETIWQREPRSPQISAEQRNTKGF